MRQVWLHHALVVMVASLVLFANLGGARLWDRDEPRNAGCALAMQTRGDWVVPVFNDELRAHKPVLLYWLMMSAYSVFGVNEFAARFWSAALGVVTALATYQIGRRLFRPRVGLLAAVILSTSLMFDLAGRAATPDSALICCSTLSLMVYVLGAFGPHRAVSVAGCESPSAGLAETDSPDTVVRFPQRWPIVVLLYAFQGFAVLAKGPVGAVLPLAVMGLFLTIRSGPSRMPNGGDGAGATRGRSYWRAFHPRSLWRTCWTLRPLTALVVIAAIAGPWYVWVGWRTQGAFLREFFLEHNWGRAQQVMEGHSGNLLFYPATILVGFFPWSVFAIPTALAAIAAARRGVAGGGRLFACCWIAAYVGPFSLAQTKLPSYVTPCYPALALLTASFFEDWMMERLVLPSLWPRLAHLVLGVAGLGILAGAYWASAVYLPGEVALGLLGLIPLLGAVVGLMFLRREQRRAVTVCFAVTALAFTVALFGYGAARVNRYQQTHMVWQAVAARGKQAQVGAFGCLEPTWIFYGGRPILETAETPRYSGIALDTWNPKRCPSAPEFFGDGRDRFLITEADDWERLRPLLPPTAHVLVACQQLFKKDQLLLIGCEPAPLRTAARPAKPGVRAKTRARDGD